MVVMGRIRFFNLFFLFMFLYLFKNKYVLGWMVFSKFIMMVVLGFFMLKLIIVIFFVCVEVILVLCFNIGILNLLVKSFIYLLKLVRRMYFLKLFKFFFV